MGAYLVEKAKQEKQQKIVQAEGETAAATMLGAAISQNPGYLKLRKLAASKKISATISQSQNRVYLNAGSLMLALTPSSRPKSDREMEMPSPPFYCVRAEP